MRQTLIDYEKINYEKNPNIPANKLTPPGVGPTMMPESPTAHPTSNPPTNPTTTSPLKPPGGRRVRIISATQEMRIVAAARMANPNALLMFQCLTL